MVKNTNREVHWETTFVLWFWKKTHGQIFTSLKKKIGCQSCQVAPWSSIRNQDKHANDDKRTA